MAKQFFKDLPNTTTPLNASRLNGLLDGEEALGNIVVSGISSKNILDLRNGTYTNNGITAVVSNGVITLNGTASDTSFIDLPTNSDINWINAKQYTISAFNPTANNMVRIRLQAGGSYDMKLTNTNQTGVVNYSSSEGIFYTKIALRVQSGEILNNFKITPQIELGLTSTEYSPFVAFYNKPYVLYENSNGSNTSITLNDDPNNYKTLEFTLANNAGVGLQIIKLDNSLTGTKTIMTYGLDNSQLILRAETLRFSGATLSFGMFAKATLTAGNVAFTSSTTTSEIKIFKVVGYK